MTVNFQSGSFELLEPSDVPTCWQIFYREVYAVKPTDRVIVDAGANIGAFSPYALRKAQQAKVTAVLPAPDSCNRIRTILKANGLESRCTLHEAALGEKNGGTTIHLDVGSQFRRTGLPGHRLKMMTLDQVIPAGVTVDLLKIDIEGAEYGVLNSVSPETLSRVDRVFVEFHPQAPASRAIDPLRANGLKVTSFQDDGEGDGLAWLDRA